MWLIKCLLSKVSPTTKGFTLRTDKPKAPLRDMLKLSIKADNNIKITSTKKTYT
jgi:hypothetical protein